MNTNRVLTVIVSAISLVAVAAIIVLFGTSDKASSQTTVEAGVPVLASTVTTKPVIEKRVPAPTTVKGYRKMFATVPVSEWGAADIALSVEIGDGRRVWLYGDTLSEDNGFVHSTAIVQDGGTVNVSRGGKQMLPDAGKVFYWPETVTAKGRNTIVVTAAPITITGSGIFDIDRHATDSRVALLKVTKSGNVVFKRWTGTVERPEIGWDDEGVTDLEILGPNHYAYAKIVHDIVLADGSLLKTTSQNWDNGWDKHHNADGSFRWTDFAPIFSSVSR